VKTNFGDLIVTSTEENVDMGLRARTNSMFLVLHLKVKDYGETNLFFIGFKV